MPSLDPLPARDAVAARPAATTAPANASPAAYSQSQQPAGAAAQAAVGVRQLLAEPACTVVSGDPRWNVAAPAGTTPDGGDSKAPAVIADAGALERSDEQLAAAIDDRVLARTGLAGAGSTIVSAAREYGVPVDFVLAMLRKESSFLSPENDLSLANNNPANLRFAEWESAHGAAPGSGGFARFPTIAEGIRAQVHLLAQDPYAGMVAQRDWAGVVNRWAPPSDGNDSALYTQQMYAYSAEYRQLLGIGEDWVEDRAVTG